MTHDVTHIHDIKVTEPSHRPVLRTQLPLLRMMAVEISRRLRVRTQAPGRVYEQVLTTILHHVQPRPQPVQQKCKPDPN